MALHASLARGNENAGRTNEATAIGTQLVEQLRGARPTDMMQTLTGAATTAPPVDLTGYTTVLGRNGMSYTIDVHVAEVTSYPNLWRIRVEVKWTDDNWTSVSSTTLVVPGMRILTTAILTLALLASPAQGADGLDELFSRLADYGFSGSVLVVRHGETLLRKGYGLADRKTGTPVTPATAFDVGSITKQLPLPPSCASRWTASSAPGTAWTRFLPRIAKSRRDRPAPTRAPARTWARSPFTRCSPTPRESKTSISTGLPSWKEFLQAILEQPLAAPPGTKFLYSNTGYDLLAKSWRPSPESPTSGTCGTTCSSRRPPVDRVRPPELAP